MPTFRAALSNLSLLRVSGVRNNFDIDELPDRLTAGHLPALLVLLVLLGSLLASWYREGR